MPPLYMYEEYDRCLKENPSKLSVYCLSVSKIIPKNDSQLWNQINAFNKDTMRHLRHDIFIYGHCVSTCENILNKLDVLQRKDLYGGLLANESINELFKKYYPEEHRNRVKYNKIINQCINYNFKEKYDLMVTSNIRYCVSNRDTKELDGPDIAFIIIVICIIGLVGLSTLYDFMLKLKRPELQDTNQHYKEPVKNYQQSLLLSFSICRNYFRLMKPSTLKYADDIRFIDTFRFVMILGVVTNHLMQITILSGIDNPDYMENFLHRFDKIILTNSNGLMASFFCLSGFVLYLTLHETLTKIPIENRQYMKLFFKAVISRYVRFTPLLAFIILLDSTILMKLADGPVWRMGIEKERGACRENWWINLLYLQNYINVEHACLPHLWYIAVDFQIYIFFIIILLLAYKYPKLKYFLIWGSIILGCLIAAIVVVIYNFNGVYIHRPEYFRHFHYFNIDFEKFYIPGHMNINGYAMGIWFGMIYLNLKENKSKIGENRIYQFLCYFAIVTGFGLIFSGEIYYQYDNIPIYLSAIYAAIYKFLYPFVVGFFALGMTQKVGWIGYEFCNFKNFRLLSRLSYSVLVIQLPILISGTFITRKPQHGSDVLMFTTGLGYIVIVYVVAFFTTLFIELPITALLKIIFENKSKNNSSKTKNIDFRETKDTKL